MCKDVLASLLDESNLKEKGLPLAHSSKVQFYHVRELPQPELGAAGDFASQSGSKE